MAAVISLVTVVVVAAVLIGVKVLSGTPAAPAAVPQVLAGQTPEQVARCLGQPKTADAKEIGAAAAAITKSLCQITGGMPTRTCSSV